MPNQSIKSSIFDTAFIIAVFRKEEALISELWEQHKLELSDQAKIAYAAYAKITNKYQLIAKDQAILEKLDAFKKSRHKLIGAMVSKLENYNSNYCKYFLLALLAGQEEVNKIISIAIIQEFFKKTAFEKLLGFYDLTELDWIYLVAQAIAERNTQALEVLVNHCKTVGILSEKEEEIDSFLKQVLLIHRREFSEYSAEQRSAVLNFFAKSHVPHFSELLKAFKTLESKDILKVIWLSFLNTSDRKNIEEKFVWHAAFEIGTDHKPIGNTILHFFASLFPAELPMDHQQCLCQFIRDYPQYINQVNYLGETPLNIACQVLKNNNELYVVETLLKLGADPNITDNQEKSPLIVAILNGNLSLIELLLSNKADRRAAIPYISACSDENLKLAIARIFLQADKNGSQPKLSEAQILQQHSRVALIAPAPSEKDKRKRSKEEEISDAESRKQTKLSEDEKTDEDQESSETSVWKPYMS